jgi:hypothetical protein
VLTTVSQSIAIASMVFAVTIAAILVHTVLFLISKTHFSNKVEGNVLLYK